MSTKKMKRMEELLKAADAFIEPSEKYPDPFEDLSDDTFELYIDAVKERKEENKLLSNNLSLLIRALPVMEEKIIDLKESINILKVRLNLKGE